MQTREAVQAQPSPAEGPGFAVLGAQGQVRLSTPSLLEHLGVKALPGSVDGVGALLESAGFRPWAGSPGVWEREGRLLRAGESRLGEARVVWTVPLGLEQTEDRQARARYLSLASHDLRGSLANARSYAGLLLGGRIPLEPKVQRGLETIARNVDRSLSFAQDFFDASRADLGLLTYEMEATPLAPLAGRVVGRHQRAASDAGVQVGVEVAEGLPDLVLDTGRAERALEALVLHQLSRAQAGEAIWVRAARSDDGTVRCEVRREGAPLPPEELRLLFEREPRAFKERKLEDALRLSLARQIAQAHGGDVHAASDSRGTSLVLSFPA